MERRSDSRTNKNTLILLQINNRSKHLQTRQNISVSRILITMHNQWRFQILLSWFYEFMSVYTKLKFVRNKTLLWIWLIHKSQTQTITWKYRYIVRNYPENISGYKRSYFALAGHLWPEKAQESLSSETASYYLIKMLHLSQWSHSFLTTIMTMST